MTRNEVTTSVRHGGIRIVVARDWDGATVDETTFKITAARIRNGGFRIVVACRRHGTTNDICLSTNILGQDQEDCGEDNSHVVTFKER